ncbi:ATP-binding protein [Geothermobacter hydrogeniphilus]|uniref:histidine kinase n=1 Tax=Geothermobacter hydrogeniphilus TaxID=1969733 RepID=A0A1X0Y0L5_9BACT|nr:GAF domain-containing protein [Geothermobacter hydrogeniphilus]ORJ58741.1 hypothetical protein B5V00_11625 [Geothermobacter hydrogeniphilus]
MHSAEEQQNKLLQAQIDIGRKLASSTEQDELLTQILRLSRNIFGFENAIIRLLEKETGELVTAASFGYPEDAEKVRIVPGEGIMGQVALTGKPLLVADVETEPGYIGGIRGARSELAVPLIANGQVIGVYNVESCRPHAFARSDIAPLLSLAGLAAIAIENSHLYRELHAASSRNRELDQLNRQILQSASLGIYSLDMKLRITSWNPRMEEFSGVKAAEALGCKLLILFPHLRKEGFEEALRQVLDGGQPGRLKLAHRNLRGELRFQKRRLAPLRDGRMITGILVMVEDITDFQRLLDQTIQTEKLAEVGRLSAGIAHEVNNPLAVISYATQLLQREQGQNSEQLELLKRIGDEVERLKTLTGGLLSFSRSGETVLRPLDLHQVLQDVLLLVCYELGRKTIELRENHDDMPLVMGDSNKLKQVFINLVMNATQAMGRGGRLTITTGTTTDGDARVVIADNGPGIPDELKAKIFEPFFTTKQEGEGTGLGLYLCSNILAEHNAGLALDTAAEGGAEFSIIFPGMSGGRSYHKHSAGICK